MNAWVSTIFNYDIFDSHPAFSVGVEIVTNARPTSDIV